MPRLVSFVKSPIRWDPSEARDSFTIYGIERVRKAFKGIGLLYFYWTPHPHGVGEGEIGPWRNEFFLLQSSPTDYFMKEPEVATVGIDALARFPCSGIITGTGEGFIIAPTLKLDIPLGRDVVMMLLLPTITNHEMSIEKTQLEIPSGEATVTLSVGNGELRCLGNISGHGLKSAKLVLNRNPCLPVFSAGFDEKLFELNGTGEVNATWKPVARTFEKCLVVFHPSKINSWYFGAIGESVGVPDNFGGGTGDYVLGDGVGVNYTIRLILNRGVGRHSSDGARLTIT